MHHMIRGYSAKKIQGKLSIDTHFLFLIVYATPLALLLHQFILPYSLVACPNTDSWEISQTFTDCYAQPQPPDPTCIWDISKECISTHKLSTWWGPLHSYKVINWFISPSNYRYIMIYYHIIMIY